MRYQILTSFRLNTKALRELIAELPDDMLGMPAHGAPNHAAWTLGHLACSFEALGGEMGIEPWLTEAWRRQFGQGSTPSSADETHPARADLLETFADAEARIVERLQSMTPADLAAPLPDVRHRERLPTVGHAAMHILCAHTAQHVGQLSVWRRSLAAGARA